MHPIRPLLALTALTLGLAALTPGHTAHAAAQTAPQRPSAETVPTHFLTMGATRFAYRELGPRTGTPLVLLQRFRGTLDDWDPALVNALAQERHVILFDNVGVGRTWGQTPTTFGAIAEDATRFVRALGYKQIDVLGFSIGGVVAQVMALQNPSLVRRLVLAGSTAGGPGIRQGSQEVGAIITQPLDVSDNLSAYGQSFFTATPAGRAAASASYRRLQARPDRGPATSQQAWGNQYAATQKWFGGTDPFSKRLGEIQQPVLIASGDRDLILPTYNDFVLLDQIPNARLVVYSDSGHGFLFQYAPEFARQVKEFLR